MLCNSRLTLRKECKTGYTYREKKMLDKIYFSTIIDTERCATGLKYT